MQNREGSRGVIVVNKSVLLVHRIKKGDEYWVLPGGGIDPGETPEEALHREILEEAGIQVSVRNKVAEVINTSGEITQKDHIFLCDYRSGKIGSGKGNEMTQKDPNNVYEIQEVPFSELNAKFIRPEKVENLVRKIIKDIQA